MDKSRTGAWPITETVFFLAAVLLSFLSVINLRIMNFCFSHFSYYLMLALFVWWLVASFLYAKESGAAAGAFWRAYGWGILLSFALAGVVFVSVRSDFRILADETNLLAISKSILYEKQVHNVTEGSFYYLNFNPIASEQIPKRPFLFPFLTSILHTLLGFRTFNPFVLNFLLLGGTFSLLFGIVRKALGTPWASAALILSAAQPVVSQTATSAGFDLLAVFFMFLSFQTLASFLESPSRGKLQYLLLTLLMLANVRYEGPLFLALTVAALIAWRALTPAVLRGAAAAVAAPFFLLPYVWQRFLVRNPFEWLDPSHPAPFGFGYFLKNAAVFFQGFVHFKLLWPYAVPVNLLGFLAAVILSVLFVLRRWPLTQTGRRMFLLSAVSTAALWAVVLTYGQGDPAHPASSRFFAYFALLAAVLTVLLFRLIAFFRNRPALVLGLAAALFFLYHPLSVENRFANALYLPREYKAVSDFLEKHGNPNMLVINDRPGMYTARNWSSVSFYYAKANRQTLGAQFKRHLYRDIFVVQEIEYATSQPTKNTALDAEFVLEPVYELQNTASSFIRISRVKDVL